MTFTMLDVLQTCSNQETLSFAPMNDLNFPSNFTQNNIIDKHNLHPSIHPSIPKKVSPSCLHQSFIPHAGPSVQGGPVTIGPLCTSAPLRRICAKPGPRNLGVWQGQTGPWMGVASDGPRAMKYISYYTMLYIFISCYINIMLCDIMLYQVIYIYIRFISYIHQL